MATFYLWSGATGTGTGASWANAYTSIIGPSGFSSGDTIYAAQDHADSWAVETQLQNIGGTGGYVNLICVNRAGSVPPVEADLRTTATFTTTGAGNHNLKVNDNWYIYGCNFIAGAGTTDTPQIRIGNGYNCSQIYENCSFYMASTGASQFSPSETLQNYVQLYNCTIKFGAITQTFKTAAGRLAWSGGGFDAAGSVPTTLFDNNDSGFYEWSGVDLSIITRFFDQPQNMRELRLNNCKMNASYTWVNNSDRAPRMCRISAVRCNSSGLGYDNFYYDGVGSLVHDSTIKGLASDGTTGFSIKATTLSSANRRYPFECATLMPFNSVTGTNRVVTVDGIWNSTALPTTDEAWLDIEHMGSASTPIITPTFGHSKITAGVANAASTKTWSGPAARANSTAYTLGQSYTAASNPGRIFFCTTAGTSAASEPGGIATATDGSTAVTDGTAAFTAGVRFKLTMTLSTPQPALIGPITVRVKCGKASSVFWIDPVAALS